jgi:four helix bundle protein
MGKSFKELAIWQRAMESGLAIYKLTAAFPDSERFGLINQLRRATVSVPSNIAEGYGRATKGEYLQFLGVARGSNCEIETQLAFARRLGFERKQELDEAEALCDEVGRMLTATIRILRV